MITFEIPSALVMLGTRSGEKLTITIMAVRTARMMLNGLRRIILGKVLVNLSVKNRVRTARANVSRTQNSAREKSASAR